MHLAEVTGRLGHWRSQGVRHNLRCLDGTRSARGEDGVEQAGEMDYLITWRDEFVGG
jgi:hypothetical protein